MSNKLQTKEPIQILDMPEPLRSFASRFLACSHHDADLGTLVDENPMIYPDFLFDNWADLNQQLIDYLKEAKR